MSVLDTRHHRSRATVIQPWEDLLAGEFAKTHTWLLNWPEETRVAAHDVFGLLLRRSDVLEGLASLSVQADHVRLHLLESAPHNRGHDKRLDGVPGNLIAFGCLLSINAGFEGNLAFDSKTELINHYEQKFGAQRVGAGVRMFIDESAALRLIDQYYRKADLWPL